MNRPFDAKRYKRLLEGLEVSVLKLSEVVQENEKLRLDSGYFAKLPVETQKRIEGSRHAKLGSLCATFRKGIFDIKADSYVEEGIPFVRIANLRDGLINDAGIAYITEQAHVVEKATALRFGDLILAKTGYAAASFVNLPECNVSQDTIAVRLSKEGKRLCDSAYLAMYLTSRYGAALMRRQFQGNVQEHLSLDDGRKIPVPLLDAKVQIAVKAALTRADAELRGAARRLAKAESMLTTALGLDGWQPPQPLRYTRRASQAFTAGRLDSEFFEPAYAELRAYIRAMRGARLGDLVREKIRRGISPEYVEFGDLPVINSQHVGRDRIALEETRTTQKSFIAQGKTARTGLIKQWDVLLNSTGRITIGRCQCVLDNIEAVVDNHVSIIRPKQGLDPVYLASFLNSRFGLMQTEQSQTGSSGQIELRPELVEDFDIWLAPAGVQLKVREQVLAAHVSRRRARELLRAAQRAVEIAIEEDEAAALAYLKGIG